MVDRCSGSSNREVRAHTPADGCCWWPSPFWPGAGTALTPCVLPVLPALLSASATGGRRRPLGHRSSASRSPSRDRDRGARLGDRRRRAGRRRGPHAGGRRCCAVRRRAAVAALGEPVERAARAARPLRSVSSGDGFWSGVLVGGALGFLYAPCAGPILAAVISVAATRGATRASSWPWRSATGSGSAMVLLALAYGGRRVIGRLRRLGRGPALQRVLGVVMVVTARRDGADLDVRFQTALANDLPALRGQPDPGARALRRGRGPAGRPARQAALRLAAARPSRASARERLSRCSARPRTSPAPGRWLNTAGGRPLTLAGLRGRVVLVDFWTYTCINCIRTLPHLRAWDARYRADGPHDRRRPHAGVLVRARRRRTCAGDRATTASLPGAPGQRLRDVERVGQPVLARQVPDRRPRPGALHALRRGRLRRQPRRPSGRCWREAGARLAGELHAGAPASGPPGTSTPETYLGYERARGFVPGAPRRASTATRGAARLPPSRFAIEGEWRGGRESATAGARRPLAARFVARRVFLVLSSRGDRPRTARVLLDGRPIRPSEAGSDVRGGEASGLGPAALPARVAAESRGPHAAPGAAAGHHRLRVHVRLARPAHAPG